MNNQSICTPPPIQRTVLAETVRLTSSIDLQRRNGISGRSCVGIVISDFTAAMFVGKLCVHMYSVTFAERLTLHSLIL